MIAPTNQILMNQTFYQTSANETRRAAQTQKANAQNHSLNQWSLIEHITTNFLQSTNKKCVLNKNVMWCIINNKERGADVTRAMTVKIDEATKTQAEEILSELGLNMTTYLVSSLKALVREKKVPFELITIQQANEEYLKKLSTSLEQAKCGEVVRYTMEELRAMEED